MIKEALFQSTLPRRERPMLSGEEAGRCQFQSTLPRRERRFFLWIFTKSRSFNPRSHEGSDKKADKSVKGRCGFNPRSHEGSDFSPFVIIKSSSKFQSTLPRRERRVMRMFGYTTLKFQSTLPRRERLSVFVHPCP